MTDDIPRLAGPRGRRFQWRVEGLPGTLLGIAVGAVGAVLAVMFSLVLFSALVVVGTLGGGYFLWRTRKLRRALREQRSAARPARERAIEGEVLRVDPLDHA